MCGDSQLASQPLFVLEDNFMCMSLSAGKLLHVLGLRRVQFCECLVLMSAFVPCSWLSFRLTAAGAAQAISIHAVVTKWFSSTRLETRTKESSTCASSQVVSLLAQ